MDKVLVSIIIPAYNAERFLERAVDSVLTQTYTNIEVVIVDDGSTDGTWQIMQNFADPRVRIFHQLNMGACVARNRGFEESHGEYVKFFDADDIMYPDAIERQVNKAIKLPNDVITYGDFSINGELQKVPKVTANMRFQKEISAGLITSLALYPRNVFKLLKGFDVRLSYSEDSELTLRCVMMGYKFEYVDVLIYNYLFGTNKNCITHSEKDFLPILIILDKYKKQLVDDRECREALYNYCIFLINHSLCYNKALYNKCADVFHRLPFKELWNRFTYEGSRTCWRIFLVLTYILPNTVSYSITRKTYGLFKTLIGFKKKILK